MLNQKLNIKWERLVII